MKFKGVIPVAGFGTRFLPITKAQPKEMLPIIDKPVREGRKERLKTTLTAVSV